MIVFYGSQTGTAEDFATRLAKDSVRYGMKKGMAADPEEYDMVGSLLGAAFLAISLCRAGSSRGLLVRVLDSGL